jgi:acetyl esterase/lipase
MNSRVFITTALLLLYVVVLVQHTQAQVQILTDVPYLAADRKEKLDLYLPSKRVGFRLPAVVYIHGGSWTGGDKSERRGKEICVTLAEAGYVAASINYRLGENAWPRNLNDCKTAVQFLRRNASTYEVDPKRIAVAGASAGGHLALMVGFTSGKNEFEPTSPYAGVSSRVRCVIDLYGPTNLMTRGTIDEKGELRGTANLVRMTLSVFGASSDQAEILRVASPVANVTKHCPPVLMAHGRADMGVEYAQSEELARALERCNVPHQLILMDDVNHGFDFEKTADNRSLPRDLRADVLKFLSHYLGR